MASSSSSSGGGEGGRHEDPRSALRDREATDALRVLGFWDAERVVGEQGHARVLAAVAYVRSRRNVKGHGAYVRRLLSDESIPAPLLWEERPSPAEPLGWKNWRSLDGYRADGPGEPWEGEPEPAAALLWQQALSLLQLHVTRPNFETWLKPTIGLALREGELVVGAASAFAEEWLRAKLRAVMSRTVSGLLNKPVDIRVVLTCVSAERMTDGDETDRGGGRGDHRDGES